MKNFLYKCAYISMSFIILFSLLIFASNQEHVNQYNELAELADSYPETVKSVYSTKSKYWGKVSDKYKSDSVMSIDADKLDYIYIGDNEFALPMTLGDVRQNFNYYAMSTRDGFAQYKLVGNVIFYVKNGRDNADSLTIEKIEIRDRITSYEKNEIVFAGFNLSDYERWNDFINALSDGESTEDVIQKKFIRGDGKTIIISIERSSNIIIQIE